MMPSVFLYPLSGGLAFFEGLIAPLKPRKGMSIPVLLRYRVMFCRVGDVGLFFGGIFALSLLFFDE